jgi:hypothetical protein
MSYRIVICVDIDASSAQDAYETLYDAMAEAERNNDDICWESSDEWYDDDGDEIGAEAAQEARLAAFNKRNDW